MSLSWHRRQLLRSHLISSYISFVPPLVFVTVCHPSDPSRLLLAPFAPLLVPFMAVAWIDGSHAASFGFYLAVLLIYSFAFVARSIWLYRRFCHDERTRLNVCLKCGYDLRVNTTGVCPECGHLPKLETWESWGTWD